MRVQLPQLAPRNPFPVFVDLVNLQTLLCQWNLQSDLSSVWQNPRTSGYLIDQSKVAKGKIEEADVENLKTIIKLINLFAFYCKTLHWQS